MIMISPTGKGCVDEVFEGPILEGKGESERERERERNKSKTSFEKNQPSA